jgi:hypothetical protein
MFNHASAAKTLKETKRGKAKTNIVIEYRKKQNTNNSHRATKTKSIASLGRNVDWSTHEYNCVDASGRWDA